MDTDVNESTVNGPFPRSIHEGGHQINPDCGKGVGVVQTTKVLLCALVIFAHPRLAFDLVILRDLVHLEWLFHSRGKSTEKNACALPPLWFGDFPSRCLQFLAA